MTSSKNQKVSAKTVFTNPIHFLAFGFGSGLVPKAPGTAGTLIAVPLVFLLSFLSLSIYLALCFAVILSGVWICHYSAKKLGVHDHPGIVWDEIAGFMITLAGMAMSWQNVILGFILFRFFDIVKPWPIKWIDKKVAGGIGIMLDDVIAGMMAWLCLYGVNVWLGS